MEDLGIPKELMDDADAMFQSGFQLVVSPIAEAKRKKGYASWSEVLTVGKAYREAKETESGDTHMVFTAQTQIMPAGETKNGGRSYFARNRVNYVAMAEVEAAIKALAANEPGAKERLKKAKDDGQYKMSIGAIRKIKQIGVAAGIDIATTGLSGEILSALFPLKDIEEHTSPLDEKVFKVSFTDNANRKYKEKNQQEIDAWAAVTVPAEKEA